MTHPAITKAIALHDDRDDETGELRDLDPREQALITSVQQITKHCAVTKGDAIRQWGDGTQAYCSTVYLAERKQEKDLTAALAQYGLGLSELSEAMLEAAE